MSTGTSTFSEIKESVKLFTKARLYLMHCVSSYPCNPSIANIKRMVRMQNINPIINESIYGVGYSDHIQGVESAKVAIGFGAQVIEKHFTTDNNLPGRDNKFAILPHELKNLSDYIKLREEMMIEHGPDYQKCESDSRENYTGRFNG
jgi:sialic acid synthase SpsE